MINLLSNRPSFIQNCMVMLLTLAIFGTSARANPHIERAFNAAHSELTQGSRAALVVFDATGAPLFAHRESELIAPASTLKLLTAIAAWHELGEDFRFETKLVGAADGSGDAISGHVALVFTGDALFERSDLRALLRAAKSAGLDRIEGDLLLDGSLFNRQDWSDAQAWNDRSICYAAPASAISLDHNCVQGNMKLKRAGEPPVVYIPSHAPIDILNSAVVVTKEESDDRLCQLELVHQGQNRYRLEGCIAEQRQRLPLSIAVNDPEHYVSQVIKAELERVGIKLDGLVRVGRIDGTVDVIALHQSEPLPVYLRRLLTDSDNHVADVLFKTLGQRRSGRAGNYQNGALALRHILAEVGIKLGNSNIVDGSGLSRHNLLSAELLVRSINHVATLEATRANHPLYAALAISGKTGSLKYKRGIINKPLRGQIRAKSGLLTGVYNLTGLIETKEAGTLRFALLVDGVSLNADQQQRRQTPGFKHPIALFYEALFEGLYFLPPLPAAVEAMESLAP